jgi:hypothetical protein
MTNKERQKSLDNKKFEASQKANRDLSGDMEYCSYCTYKLGQSCFAKQEEKESNNLCARSYNRMVRKLK